MIQNGQLQEVKSNGAFSQSSFSSSGSSQAGATLSEEQKVIQAGLAMMGQTSLEGAMQSAGNLVLSGGQVSHGGSIIGESFQGQVLYSKPQIIQSQEIISQPIIERKVVEQPIITKKVVTQPIIKQRVVQTPIIRKKEVNRPVYTEEIQNEPIVDS